MLVSSIFFYNMDKNEKIFKQIINKQLEQYDIDFDYVLKNNEIDGKPWYLYYTFKNKNDFEQWKAFSIKLMIEKLKYNKDYAERTFEMINLNYGLKRDYEID